MRLSRPFWSALAAQLSLAGALLGAPLRTNLDLAVDTVEQGVDELLARMDTAAPGVDGRLPFRLEAQAKHEANWLVEHVLVERLVARGFAVVLDSTTAPPEAPRLRYRVVELGVDGRSGLWGGQVHRRSHLVLGLSLTRAPDQTLAWRDEVKANQEDQVAKARLPLVQETPYAFAKTEMEEKTWGRFVEPAVVSSVLGGLVYLFFSNR